MSYESLPDVPLSYEEELMEQINELFRKFRFSKNDLYSTGLTIYKLKQQLSKAFSDKDYYERHVSDIANNFLNNDVIYAINEENLEVLIGLRDPIFNSRQCEGFLPMTTSTTSEEIEEINELLSKLGKSKNYLKDNIKTIAILEEERRAAILDEKNKLKIVLDISDEVFNAINYVVINAKNDNEKSSMFLRDLIRETRCIMHFVMREG